jgi:2-polyprenyl-3-methyl-5-hydroxy-6-metoxy-1,4-benzoquinol methylase
MPGGRAALDLGTGPGTQAIALARLGYVVTGTDISQGAIEYATARASADGVEVSFECDDILKSKLTGPFDVIIDRGCLHVLRIDKRPVYCATVRRLLKPEGVLILKCFSPAETRRGGPHRISTDELTAIFASDYESIVVRESEYQGTIHPPPRAYVLSAIRRSNS